MRLSVTLNGTLLGTTTIESDGEFRVTFPVPATAINQVENQRIVLEISPTFIPAQVLENSEDQRELGVQINSVSLIQLVS